MTHSEINQGIGLWLYFNRLEDSNIYPWPTHTISINLEGTSFLEMDAVRLIIIDHRIHTMGDIVHFDRGEFADSELFLDKYISDTPPSHPKTRFPTTRDLISARSRSRAVDKLNTHSRVLDIYLEVVFDMVDHEQQLVLKPLGPLANDMAEGVPDSRSFRIAYDCTFPHLGSSSARSWHIVLRSYTYADAKPYPPVLRYTLRILPLSHNEPPRYRAIPPYIIWSIANYALNMTPYKRREPSLLNLALVQKSWLHVLDLHWVRLWMDTDCIGNLPATSRFLQANRDYALQFRKFSIRDVDGFLITDYPGSEKHKSAQVLLSLIEMVERLHIPHSLFVSTMESLRTFKHVKELMLLEHQAQPVEIEELLRGIHSWAGLKKLDAGHWVIQRRGKDELQSPMSNTRPEATVEPATYQLQRLRLYKGELNMRHFWQFVSHPSPAMTILNLIDLSGLSNANYRDFFFAVRSTLEQLQFYVVMMPLSAEEEFALESVLPHMPALWQVTIDGNLITNHAISRKRPCREDSYFEVTRYAPPKVLSNGTSERLSQSMQMTGWNHIQINGSSWNHGDYDRGTLDIRQAQEMRDAFEVARSRDITLEIPQQWRDLVPS